MKISLKWLNDFVDVSEFFANPNALADILTRAGLEVEEIQNRAKDLNHVVIGHIKTKDKHPNADKLSLCQVEIAGGKIEQIVCGAQNHKVGDKVVVALPGAILPGNFAIKKSKIRDVESNGMLCSVKELGLATESDGILILDSSAPVGKSFAEFGGYDDISFELKVTPNRADCLSHFGLAREIGCLLNKKVKSPEVLTKFNSASTKSKIKLEVLESELCPRYCGRYIANVKIGPSPEWLVKRLESIGQNSINNVVDITNYVMHEMGQPLHAFDADQLQGGVIQVKKASKNEKFKTLKEQEITLNGEELLICDQSRPVALAGVIGGLNSGVSDKTKNIFLESASFNAMSVRKTSRVHGVDTDSAYRFSRGVDQSGAQIIMDHAALLIQQVAGGDVFSEAYDIYPKPQVKKPVNVSLKKISQRLGYEVDEKLFLNYMNGLQIKVETKSPGVYLMTPPLFRFDLEQEMDLVEEYARLYGYEHIQETIPALQAVPATHDQGYMLNQKISEQIRVDGYHQAFNYAFSSEILENKMISDVNAWNSLGLPTDSQAIKIKNPLSEDISVMRRCLSLGLYKNLLDNVRAGNERGALFEMGAVFSKKTSDYQQKNRLALVVWGEPLGLYAQQAPIVFKIKNVLEKLFQYLQITKYSFESMKTPLGFLHQGQCSSVVVEGEALGFIGTLHPGLLNEEKIRVPVAIAELNLDNLLKGQPRASRFKSLSKFQPIERDFSFIMDQDKPAGDLLKEIKKACGPLLKEITIFDIYEGEKLAAGKKSISIKTVFQTIDQQMAEPDVQKICQKIVETAKSSVGASLR